MSILDNAAENAAENAVENVPENAPDFPPHELMAHAAQARQHAYAPYSNFQVGAALLCKDGRIFHGCNVENASYGLCNCAERSAFFNAISAGYRRGQFQALAVIGATAGPISPCGACRQVVLELGGAGLEVVLGNVQGEMAVTSAGALLPGAFGPEDLQVKQTLPIPGNSA
jgi:cytidine deaminase